RSLVQLQQRQRVTVAVGRRRREPGVVGHVARVVIQYRARIAGRQHAHAFAHQFVLHLAGTTRGVVEERRGILDERQRQHAVAGRPGRRTVERAQPLFLAVRYFALHTHAALDGVHLLLQYAGAGAGIDDAHAADRVVLPEVRDVASSHAAIAAGALLRLRSRDHRRHALGIEAGLGQRLDADVVGFFLVLAGEVDHVLLHHRHHRVERANGGIDTL